MPLSWPLTQDKIRMASNKDIIDFIYDNGQFFGRVIDTDEVDDENGSMREYLNTYDESLLPGFVPDVKDFLITNLDALNKSDVFRKHGGRKSRRSRKTNKRSKKRANRRGTRRNRRR